MAVSCIISAINRDISRKSRFFHTPVFDAPVRESPIGIVPERLVRKTRMVKRIYGVIVCL